MIASRRRADSRDSYRIAIENAPPEPAPPEPAPPEPAPPGPAPPEPAPPGSDHVELHPVQHGVVLDRARVGGPAPQRLPVRLPGPPHVGVGDRGERDQLDRVHLDPAQSRADRVPAARLDLGPLP